MSTHVKVARCVLTNEGKEIILSLNDGGEAKLMDRQSWKSYHEFVQSNPQVRGTKHYPWAYVEDIDNPPNNFTCVLRPEKTGGAEFKPVNAKN